MADGVSTKTRRNVKEKGFWYTVCFIEYDWSVLHCELWTPSYTTARLMGRVQSLLQYCVQYFGIIAQASCHAKVPPCDELSFLTSWTFKRSLKHIILGQMQGHLFTIELSIWFLDCIYYLFRSAALHSNWETFVFWPFQLTSVWLIETGLVVETPQVYPVTHEQNHPHIA